ncbi:DNA repair protein [Tenacibaculum phage Gundel_1]|uniref:JAB domain-containing protein n=1 Tax=Tenacibaculum phage Gundel_1 TaxID=2745672 RepID=A0A8E5E9S1_9CAUD|nr:DNA repair protein [Tenacibaculum phage Gundel_1]QQV91450.1 JAB domain-containing protein [Tenacibaculum phage Gundel_1]
MKEYKTDTKQFTLKKTKSNFKQCKIKSSADGRDFAAKFYHEDIAVFESMFCIFLNNANNTTGWCKISQGGLSGTVVDPILIGKYAIESLAKSVILVHNHPSGTLKPSQSDLQITTKIKKTLDIFDCKVLDHLIMVEGGNYYSFADEGIL